MIFSNNTNPSLEAFRTLVNNANDCLNNEALKNPEYFLSRSGLKLEEDVFKALTQVAIGTSFEGTIKLISGQRFPDIVAARFYGVEVKSSKDSRWITIGGSINESTRDKDVQRIFLTFGKLVAPVRFISRPYEECLADVVVTHYPRYIINMNLQNGETVFDRMGTTYDDIRLSNNAVGRLKSFYKSQLGDGERLWWLDDEENSMAPMTIRTWNKLPIEERKLLQAMSYAYFPEMFGESTSKFERLSLWLISQHNIVSSSLRDVFTAGGKKTIIIHKKSFESVPKIFFNASLVAGEIVSQIINAPKEMLMETWRVHSIENGETRVSQWIDIASKISRYGKTQALLEAIFQL